MQEGAVSAGCGGGVGGVVSAGGGVGGVGGGTISFFSWGLVVWDVSLFRLSFLFLSLFFLFLPSLFHAMHVFRYSELTDNW